MIWLTNQIWFFVKKNFAFHAFYSYQNYNHGVKIIKKIINITNITWRALEFKLNCPLLSFLIYYITSLLYHGQIDKSNKSSLIIFERAKCNTLKKKSHNNFQQVISHTITPCTVTCIATIKIVFSWDYLRHITQLASNICL